MAFTIIKSNYTLYFFNKLHLIPKNNIEIVTTVRRTKR